MIDMVKIDLPWFVEERNRHGRVVRYVRRAGVRVRILPKPGDLDFIPAYQAALQELRDKIAARGGAPKEDHHRPARGPDAWPTRSLGWLIERYYAESSAFATMKPAGQRRRRAILDDLKARFGTKPMAMTPDVIEAGKAKRAAQRGKANEWVKAVKALYAWACDSARLISVNPAASVKKIRVVTDGFHTWEIDEARRFTARHPPGTMAYAALMILIFTGLRREDASKFGRQHLRDGKIRFRTGKTGAELMTGVAWPLRAALDATSQATEGEHLAFLRTSRGLPFASGNAFGGWFKDRCAEAGIPHCSAHGVRKFASMIADEEGVSEDQINAMFTWVNPNQSATYTRKADRSKMASAGFDKVAARLVSEGVIAQTTNSHVAPFSKVAAGATKTGV